MKKMPLVIICSALIFFSISFVRADTFKFNALDLFKYCQASENIIDKKPIAIEDTGTRLMQAGWCTGFLLGLDAMQEAMAGKFTNWPDDFAQVKKEFYYCLPDGVSKEQLIRSVVKYGTDHPESLHLQADIFVIKAFKHYYPCE